MLNEPARHYLPQRFQEHEQSVSIPANHYIDIPATSLSLHIWPLTQKKRSSLGKRAALERVGNYSGKEKLEIIQLKMDKRLVT